MSPLVTFNDVPYCPSQSAQATKYRSAVISVVGSSTGDTPTLNSCRLDVGAMIVVGLSPAISETGPAGASNILLELEYLSRISRLSVVGKAIGGFQSNLRSCWLLDLPAHLNELVELSQCRLPPKVNICGFNPRHIGLSP